MCVFASLASAAMKGAEVVDMHPALLLKHVRYRIKHCFENTRSGAARDVELDSNLIGKDCFWVRTALFLIRHERFLLKGVRSGINEDERAYQ